jgi:transposase
MDASELAYVESLKSENFSLLNENISLKEQLDWFRRQVFGKRSERIVRDLDDKQLCFEGWGVHEKEEAQEREVKAHKRTVRRKGQDTITLPEDLPVEQVVIDVTDAEKKCPETGESLTKIGEEVSHKLAYRPGSYYIKEIVRPKYGLPGGAGVLTAELPDSILPRCRADESFLAEILVQKFANHLPLYRIAESLSREGIGISRQLLSQWVLGVGQALDPLFNEMQKAVLASESIHIDESPVNLQEPGRGKVKQAYMWVMVGGSYRTYHFRPDRKHCHAADLLKGYGGIVHSDKYAAYEQLANQKQIIWCPCWAHIRRKFFEAETDPPFRQWVLRKIRYLFMFEKVAWARSEEERLRIREEKEKPIIDELISKIKEKLISGRVLPKSKLREALGYFCGLIPHLKNYLRYAEARLDNNIAERAIRPLAIGRKNWLFVGSPAGGRAAGTILSLVQTCRALEINPREYLEDVMRRLQGHSAHRLAELLPDRWAAARQA